MGDTITARLPCKHGVHDNHPTLDPAAQRASDRVGWCDGYQEITLRRDRIGPHHTAYIDGTGWRLAHPLTCDLQNCPFDAEARSWTIQPVLDGVWHWGPDLDEWMEVTDE